MNKLKTLLLILTIIFGGISIFTFIPLGQSGIGPQIKKDQVMYHNKFNEEEKLIFQYYETGIGGMHIGEQ